MNSEKAVTLLLWGGLVVPGCYEGLGPQPEGAMSSSTSTPNPSNEPTTGGPVIDDTGNGDSTHGSSSSTGDSSSTGVSVVDGSTTGSVADSSGGEPNGFPARDITLSALVVNQGVEQLIFAQGAESSPDTPMIEGRYARFTATAELAAGFEPRPVEGRLELWRPDGSSMVFSDLRTIDEPNTLPRFSWTVGPDDLPHGTRYQISLWEDVPTGISLDEQPRLPPLEPSELPMDPNPELLRIMLVPYRHLNCDSAAVVNDTVLEDMQRYLESILPVQSVEIILHDEVGFSGVMKPYDDVLTHLTELRSEESAPDDILYYGYTASCEQAQSGSCAGGLAWRGNDNSIVGPDYRAAVGGRPCPEETFGPLFAEEHLTTMTHEIGHNLGRRHVACSGNEGGPDPDYPHPGGIVNIWGWDGSDDGVRSPDEFDLMTYCGPPDGPNWTSDYGWKLHEASISLVNAGMAVARTRAPRLLLTIGDDGRIRGRVVRLPALERIDHRLTAKLGAGRAPVNVSAQRLYTDDSDAITLLVDQPAAGWSAVDQLIGDVQGRPVALDRSAWTGP